MDESILIAVLMGGPGSEREVSLASGQAVVEALLAEGLKAAGSLMWTGTPIPQNLKEIAATGVPLAANVKPFDDRKKMFEGLSLVFFLKINEC